MVLLEAWSHQTPVITWDLPVFNEIVTHGQNGLLQPPDDEDLSSVILEMLNDSERSADMGQQGHDTVKSMFDWSRVTERYLRVYEQSMRDAQTH